MPPRQTRSWLVGLIITTVLCSVLAGAAVGGLAGYFAATELVPQAQLTAAGPTSPSSVDSAVSELQRVAPAEPSLPAVRQSLTVTEESGNVDAVNTVLPAVVTVLTQGSRGAGSGSGFFISADGYLVTNHHVVANARDIVVVFAQGGTAEATLIGSTPDFDLAVLQVNEAIPVVVEWGDSGELPLGSHVIAIGSALGRYQNTVTAGVLSGFNRELGELRGLLQTDAAINQGNSGGPLINLSGQVIGINTAIVRGGFRNVEGVGFAIPSNIARTVVRHLIESGEVTQPFLGVRYQPLNPQLATEEELAVVEGAFIQETISGTPADRAGLQAGDIILAVDGKSVDDRHPLVSLLLEHVAGETVNLEILRDDQMFETELVLGER
ncbi:MAG: S1C family serine protease [Anaerolineae bacterium]